MEDECPHREMKRPSSSFMSAVYASSAVRPSAISARAPAASRDALPGSSSRLGVEAQHLPDHAAHVAARIDVVADERDACGARWRSISAMSRRDAARDPRVEPVRDDVVERRHRREIREIELREGEVARPMRARVAAGLDRLRGDVEADELALRQRVRHRDELAASPQATSSTRQRSIGAATPSSVPSSPSLGMRSA